MSEEVVTQGDDAAKAALAKAVATAPATATVDDVKRIVAEAMAEHTKAAQSTIRRSSALQAVLDKKKLRDVPAEFLTGAPDTDDAVELNAWADARIERINQVMPGKIAANVGGANYDGGNGPGKGPTTTAAGTPKRTPAALITAAIERGYAERTVKD